MPRYIDADKLYDRFEMEYKVTGGITHKVLSHVLNKIAEADDEDVEPVHHAHWIYHAWNPVELKYTCSRCGAGMDSERKRCPDCGAKMDEEVNENDR